MALKARVMPYGTIIFIALILVVACSLLYWLSALCGLLAPEAGRKGAQEASTFQLEINWTLRLLMLANLLSKQRGRRLLALELFDGHCVQGSYPTHPMLPRSTNFVVRDLLRPS
jgi:hypothetical protein